MVDAIPASRKRISPLVPKSDDCIGIKVQNWMAQRLWSYKIRKTASNIWNIIFRIYRELFFFELHSGEFLDSFAYVSTDRLTLQLWTFIFYELKEKSDHADDLETAKRISSARGDWILMDSDWNSAGRRELMRYVTDIKYDERFFLWHIATELCYSTEDDGTTKQTKDNGASSLNEEFSDADYRLFSKTLSDYMMYLLVRQLTMMSSVAGIGNIIFRDTYAEANRFFVRRRLVPGDQQKACKQILCVNTDVEPVHVKGDYCKSVLFDACILAKKLKALDLEDNEESKWKMLSRMWVELMSYAAVHCHATDHGRKLSEGGELITFVWLLMAQFGLGEQFQSTEKHGRAKLVVGK